MILILTNKEDVHPNPVIDLWTKWGVPFFRLNTEALLTDYTFWWRADHNGCDFYVRCAQTGLEVRGSEITALWERRPEPPKCSLPNTFEIDRHNQQEALGFLQFLRYYLKDIPSIGSIVGDRIAASKMLQQKIALECGFEIPETIFANRKEYVSKFASNFSRLAIKSIENAYINDDLRGKDYVFYTQTLDAQHIPNIPEEAFSQTVSFIQQYIPKKFELRVTIVGQEIFAARIDSQDAPETRGAVDWREIENEQLRVAAYELSEDIKMRCLSFIKRMGLQFGCIDLIVTPENKIVFLECNPNGQWLWVELKTGQTISRSIALWLSGQKGQ